MTIKTVKAMVAKVATMGLLAGAVALAAPGKAEAQVRFGVGVNFGGPVVYPHRYYAPPPVVYRPYPVYGYGYYHHPYVRPYAYDRYHHVYGGYYR